MGILPASAAYIWALWNIHGASPEFGQRCEQIERSLGWAEAKREGFSGDCVRGQLHSPRLWCPDLLFIPWRTHVHFSAWRWSGRIVVVRRRVFYLHVCNERQGREARDSPSHLQGLKLGFLFCRECTQPPNECIVVGFFSRTTLSPEVSERVNWNYVGRMWEKTQNCTEFFLNLEKSRAYWKVISV